MNNVQGDRTARQGRFVKKQGARGPFLGRLSGPLPAGRGEAKRPAPRTRHAVSGLTGPGGPIATQVGRAAGLHVRLPRIPGGGVSHGLPGGAEARTTPTVGYRGSEQGSQHPAQTWEGQHTRFSFLGERRGMPSGQLRAAGSTSPTLPTRGSPRRCSYPRSRWFGPDLL